MSAMSTRIRSQRDVPGQVQRRFRAIGNKRASEDGTIDLEISSDDCVDMGYIREVLSHAPDAIDTSTCTALCVNHDVNQIAGPVSAISTDGRVARCKANILASARLVSGVTVREAVASGALLGVSIGYTYDLADCSFDEATGTRTVKRWRLLEVTLTPCPADPAAGVRSVKETTMNLELLLKLFPHQRDLVTRLHGEKKTPEEIAEAVRAADASVKPSTMLLTEPIGKPLPNADEAAKAARSAAKAEAREIAIIAASLGLAPDDFIGQDLDGARSAMIAKMVEQRKAGQPPATRSPEITVRADAADKLIGACRASLFDKAQITATKREADELDRLGVSEVRLGFKSMLREVARASGEDVTNWSDFDLAAWAMPRIDLRSHGRRDAPNKTSGMFSTLLANVATKAILAGLNGYNGATWSQWCTQRSVPDFRAVSNVNLSSGVLTKTAEGKGFPELTQKDGGYNSTLGMYGATVTLSMQTIINDQLGTFLGELRRSGNVAGETIDKQAFAALLGATWTNDISTTCGLGTAGKLDTVRALLKKKLGPAGNKMGIVGRFLLCDPALLATAQQQTGEIYAGGQTGAVSTNARSIRAIESQWVSDTSLLAGALTTDWFLLGDPNAVDTVLVNFLEGVGMNPIVLPFDPGAVAAEKWKIMLPFEATIATHTDSAGNARVSGIHRATA
jgi:hypothetical protein